MARKTVTKKRAQRKTAVRKAIVRKAVTRRRAKPKGIALVPAAREENNRQALYVVTEHWVSDLKFYNDELRFFRRLIDRYFLWLIEKENIESTKAVAQILAGVENERLGLEKKVGEHLQHLASLIEHPFSRDAHAHVLEHGRMEKAMAGFTKDFRAVKKEVFTIAEAALDSEKAKRLSESMY